jgi:hypothetical protein
MDDFEQMSAGISQYRQSLDADSLKDFDGK